VKDNPNTLWNIDELGFQTALDAQKVIAAKEKI